jgi:hypothetical protein
MRTVVFDRDLLEKDVKPQGLLDDYRRKLETDVPSLLARPEKLVEGPCPACRSEKAERAFDKYGLTYQSCRNCGTLYVNPRPAEVDLVRFYRESEAARFWRDHLLKDTLASRRVKVFRPRVRWLLDVVDKYRPKPVNGVVAGYHNDLLLDELYHLDPGFCPLIVTNPVADLEFEGLTLEKASVRPTRLEDLPALGSVDLFLAFDLLDRCQDPDGWLAAAKKTLAPGGLLLANATLVTGFDLQMLWDRAENLHPPDRLNLFSTEGLTELYSRHGFEAVEFSTPGSFDVDAVRRAVAADPEAGWPRFIRHMLMNRDDRTRDEFQEFLQKNRLSSFGRLVLKSIG